MGLVLWAQEAERGWERSSRAAGSKATWSRSRVEGEVGDPSPEQ